MLTKGVIPMRVLRDIRIWGALVVAAAALAAFSLLPELGFVRYDDDLYVFQNRVVCQGLTCGNWWWALTTFTASNWHPLTWWSHLLDVSLYGLWPGGHHVTSLLLHVANGVLLFWVLARLTRALWPSLAVALLWVVHPLRVESVAWVSERKDVLSGFFALLTLWLYARYAERPTPRRLGAVTVTFALGLMAKPMLVTLPCVLLLLDFWPLARFKRRSGVGLLSLGEGATRDLFSRANLSLVREKLPLFLLAALAAGITLVAQRRGAAVRDFEEVPLFWRLTDMVWDTFAYVRQTVWPPDLAVIYSGTREWLTPGTLLVALTVVILGFWAAWACRWRRPWVTVGWLWYAGVLFPVSGIVSIGSQAQADRYSYLPQIGLLILVVWTCRAWLCRLTGEHEETLWPGQPSGDPLADAGAPLSSGRGWLWGGAAVGTITILLAGMTWVQTGFWRNSVTLFASAVDAYPQNCRARYGLGVSLLEAGQPAAAEPHLAVAAAIAPQFPDHFFALAFCLAGQGRHAESVREYRRALQMTPDNTKAYYLLGVELDKMGRRSAALKAVRTSLQLQPAAMEPGLTLAWWLATDPDPARRDGAEAVRLAQNVCRTGEGKLSPSAWNTLAAAQAECGQFSEAVAAAREAIRLAGSTGAGIPAVLNERLAAYEHQQPWREPRVK